MIFGAAKPNSDPTKVIEPELNLTVGKSHFFNTTKYVVSTLNFQKMKILKHEKNRSVNRG